MRERGEEGREVIYLLANAFNTNSFIVNALMFLYYLSHFVYREIRGWLENLSVQLTSGEGSTMKNFIVCTVHLI